MNYVYILVANGYFKIGVTNNINKRIKALQTGCPFKIELVALLETKEHYKIESELHVNLKHFQTHGEWFMLDKDHFDSIVLDYDFEVFNDSFLFREDKESALELNVKSLNNEVSELSRKLAQSNSSLQFEYDKAFKELEGRIQKSKSSGFEYAIEVLNYYKNKNLIK